MVLLQSSDQINFKNEIQIEEFLNFCSKTWKKSLFLAHALLRQMLPVYVTPAPAALD